MSEPTLVEAIDLGARWQRVSPIALIYFIVATIKGVASNFIYLIPMIVVLKDRFVENPQLGLVVIAVVGLIFVATALLSYWFFRFRIHDDTVEIRSGVLSRKQLNLPFTRIQSVKMDQPIYYRFTDHVLIEFDTAGSSKSEAKLAALDRTLAIELKQVVMMARDAKDTGGDSASNDDTSVKAEKLIIDREVADLVLHGLTNNRAWLIIAALAPVFDDLGEYIIAWADRLGFDAYTWFDVEARGVVVLGLMILGVLLFVLMLVSLLSVLGAVIVYYGYTLHRDGDRYIRRAGLITKREVAMPLKRLQKIKIKQDWLDRLIKRANIYYEQINHSGPESKGAQQELDKIMVPSVQYAKIGALLNDVLPSHRALERDYTAISKRYLLKHLLMFGLPATIIFGGIAFGMTMNGLTAAVVAAPVMIFMMIRAYWAWRRWGFDYDDNFIAVRSGAFGVDHRVFYTHKVQQLSIVQSRFMARRKLVTVKFVLASGAVSVPYLTIDQALRLRDHTLTVVEQSRQSWM